MTVLESRSKEALALGDRRVDVPAPAQRPAEEGVSLAGGADFDGLAVTLDGVVEAAAHLERAALLPEFDGSGVRVWVRHRRKTWGGAPALARP